jgi:hypothetical protein
MSYFSVFILHTWSLATFHLVNSTVESDNGDYADGTGDSNDVDGDADVRIEDSLLILQCAEGFCFGPEPIMEGIRMDQNGGWGGGGTLWDYWLAYYRSVFSEYFATLRIFGGGGCSCHCLCVYLVYIIVKDYYPKKFEFVTWSTVLQAIPSAVELIQLPYTFRCVYDCVISRAIYQSR